MRPASAARRPPESRIITRFTPLIARSATIHASIAPVAYDCVKLIFIRSGSAILLSEFGEQAVKPGDVIALGANTLCGSEPEGSITVTTLYLDRDYVIDQVFWQHAALLSDRLAAQDFAGEVYSEPAQILRLGEHRAGMLMPWLDELVALSIDGPSSERFYRMQALLFAVLWKTTRPGLHRLVSSLRYAPRHGKPLTCSAMPPIVGGHFKSWQTPSTSRPRNSAASSSMPTGRHQ